MKTQWASILPCKDAKIMKIEKREAALTYKKYVIALFWDLSAAETWETKLFHL
jgi:hypothetical protein